VVAKLGGDLATALGLTIGQLSYLARCLLDEMRSHGALSRPLLTFHPAGTECPDDFKSAPEWERRLKRPQGYPCAPDGKPVGYLDKSEIPEGISLTNSWRRSNRGRPPRLQRTLEHLVERMSRQKPTQSHLEQLLSVLQDGGLLAVSKLCGFTKSRVLLQVEADCVELELVAPDDR